MIGVELSQTFPTLYVGEWPTLSMGECPPLSVGEWPPLSVSDLLLTIYSMLVATIVYGCMFTIVSGSVSTIEISTILYRPVSTISCGWGFTIVSVNIHQSIWVSVYHCLDACVQHYSSRGAFPDHHQYQPNGRGAFPDHRWYRQNDRGAFCGIINISRMIYGPFWVIIDISRMVEGHFRVIILRIGMTYCCRAVSCSSSSSTPIMSCMESLDVMAISCRALRRIFPTRYTSLIGGNSFWDTVWGYLYVVVQEGIIFQGINMVMHMTHLELCLTKVDQNQAQLTIFAENECIICLDVKRVQDFSHEITAHPAPAAEIQQGSAGHWCLGHPDLGRW